MVLIIEFLVAKFRPQEVIEKSLALFEVLNCRNVHLMKYFITMFSVGNTTELY